MKQLRPFTARRTRLFAAFSLALILTLFSNLLAFAATPVLISTDPYTNTTSNHATEVEPDTFSFGATIVEAAQIGRFYDGGASNIGWATSTNNGGSWTSGNLPGITKFQGGTYDRVSDASVAYDAKHGVWLISSLPLLEAGGVHGAAIVVNRSADSTGTVWTSNPVTIVTGADLDKNWTVCDNTSTSPYYGNCYTEWDDHGNSNRIKMSTSSDGGLTWSTPKNPSGNPAGIGGQPVVQPNGTVIVPMANASETAIGAFRSTNGGSTWSSVTTIASVSKHTVAGNLRTGPLPSAEIDGAGKVYVVWQDCRFRTNCTANDIVMTSSTNGTSWSAVTRIPIDSTTSGIDHFIPGIGVDKTTSGSTARLALAYYYYPISNCGTSCQLYVGYISSSNGGTSWSAASQLDGPMSLTWAPLTSQGYMVGDYISTSFGSDGLAHPVYAIGKNAPTSCNGNICQGLNQGMYSPASGLALSANVAAANQTDNSNQHPTIAADNAWNATANEAHNGSSRD